MIGVLYASDKTSMQNFAQAAKWFRKAADKSWPDAEYQLALLYAHGQGVAQNQAEAKKLLDQAAQHDVDGAAQAHSGD